MSRCRMIAVISMVVVVSMGGVGWAAEYWVHPDGNDSNPGTEQEPFETIQYAINQCTSDNNDIIHIQNDPWEIEDYVTPPIDVNCSKLHFIFYEGVVVAAEPNKFHIPDPNHHWLGDSLFTVQDRSNIVFDGNETTFRMRKSEYEQEEVPGSGRHVISLKSCSDVNIMGLTLEDSGGDGVFISRGTSGNCCEDILIKDVVCDNNYRNAISVISVDGLTIENCVLKNTTGTDPQAGIDFEPNNDDEMLKNIVMRNCVLENNYKQGICVSPHKLDSSSEPISLLFEDCYVTGGWSAGLRVSYVHGPSGSIEFKNITVEDVNYYGARIFDKSSDSAYVRFTNCLWQNITDQPGRPVYISVQNMEVDEPGGIDFIDCQVYDDVDRPAIEYD